MNMSRGAVVQALLDKLGAGTYLEIGVAKRRTFSGIKAKRKIGVDPHYWLFSEDHFLKAFRPLKAMKNLCKIKRSLAGEQFFEMTSTRFFASRAAWLKRRPADVCFVDGLHTYAQSYEDVVNAAGCLSTSGVLVLDDCSPSTAAMAYPAASYREASQANPPGWTGAWTGEVWKTVVRLRSEFQDLRVFVLNTPFGLGIVTRGKPESMLPYSPAEIERMTYEDLARNRTEWLNLKEPAYFLDFLKSLKRG